MMAREVCEVLREEFSPPGTLDFALGRAEDNKSAVHTNAIIVHIERGS
jgi:hypothetical protein